MHFPYRPDKAFAAGPVFLLVHAITYSYVDPLMAFVGCRSLGIASEFKARAQVC